MTSMERVLAALRGEPSDRRAFTMTLSLYGAKLTGCSMEEYFTNPQKYLDGQIAVSQQCKPDILFAPFALALEAQAFGSEILFLDKQPPNVCKLKIRNPADIGLMKIPNSDSDEGLRFLLEAAKLMAGHFTQNCPVCGVLTSPLDLPALIMGVENWLEILLFDRQKAVAVVATMLDYFVDMANKMFENGVSFIVMAMVFCNPQILLDTIVVDFIVPSLMTIFSKVKGPLVFHHGSVPIAKYLPMYLNLPNVAGFVLDHRDSLDAARSATGENRLLLGNMDGPTLGKMSTANAIDKARRILENRRTDRHFIFATSGADVGWDTPLETITGVGDLVGCYRGTDA